MKTSESVITLADEKVPISVALRLVGVDYDTAAGSRKQHCPFGPFYHSDGGLDPAMRVYPDSNHAYCFSCSLYLTSSKVYSLARGMTRKQAAAELLEHIGYAHRSLKEAWRQALTFAPELDRANLAEALKTFCARRHPRWSEVQFDTEIAAVLARCLELLANVTTEPEAMQWLELSKVVMGRVLTRSNLADSGL